MVGQGPLVRVLKVHRDGGQISGMDPSTKAVVTTFPPADPAAHRVKHLRDPAVRIFRLSATHDLLDFRRRARPEVDARTVGSALSRKGPGDLLRDRPAIRIARNPEIFQREVREGHAVANHSLTHVDVSTTSNWRARLALTVTDHVIRAVTGKEVGCSSGCPMRGTTSSRPERAIEGLLRSQRYGYLVASHDYDSDDWRYASHELTGEMPLPELKGQNITVLLHDGGGPGREMTIDYVRKFISHAKSQGYTFTTMPEVNPWIADRVFDIKPTIWDKLTLNLVEIWFVWPTVLLRALFVIAVAFVVVIGLSNCVIAAIRRRRRNAFVWPSASENPVPVSVLLAAYNEEQIIDRTLRSVLASKYPLAEVIVVNDGSTTTRLRRSRKSPVATPVSTSSTSRTLVRQARSTPGLKE